MRQNDGLVRIEEFFPPKVAEGLLAAVTSMPKKRWEVEKNSNDISSHFMKARPKDGVLTDPIYCVTNALAQLMPGKLHQLQAAKYVRGHHIEEHDDHKYENMVGRAAAMATHSFACGANRAPVAPPASPALHTQHLHLPA